MKHLGLSAVCRGGRWVVRPSRSAIGRARLERAARGLLDALPEAAEAILEGGYRALLARQALAALEHSPEAAPGRLVDVWLALVDDGAPVPEPLQEAVAEVLRALRTAPNKADAEAVARALRIRRSVDWDLRTEQAGLLYAALRDAGYTHEECKELVSQLVPEVDEDAAAAAYRRLLK